MSTQKTSKQPQSMNSSGSSSSTNGSSSKRNQMRDTVIVGLDIVANIAEGSDILAPLKAACRTTKLILEVTQAVENNREEWKSLSRRLEGYTSALEERTALIETYDPRERAIVQGFRQPLIRYLQFLKSTYDTVIEIEKRSRSKIGFFKAFSKVKTDAGEIIRLNRDVEDQHRQFMEALTLFIGLRVRVIEENTKNIQANVDATAILQLPTVPFVASSVHSTCLKGTREAVLQTIWHWADDDASEKPIFWLCDIAGSGKSTVAMSAVETWQKQGVLGGFFFFSIASSEGSTTEKFCSAIARDMAHYIPELAPHVAAAVKRNPSFMRSSLDEQFQMLVCDPVHHRQGRVILVIDALDECKSGPRRRELVDALSAAVRKSKNLKIFITSRPDPVVQAVLGSLSIKAKLEDRLHDVKHRDNVDDIALYIHQSLNGVLSHDKRQRLVKKANGLFIWASTACQMLTRETIMSSPEDIYDRLISMEQTGVIDNVYDLVFERTDSEYHEVMCTMLALLLAAFEPITVDDLDDLMKHGKIRGSAKALVQNLGSVLSRDETTNLIQFRHPTLVEYLRRCSIDPANGSRNKLRINVIDAHGQAASWCFKRLKSPTEGLRFNICQIESSFYLNRQIPDLDTKVTKLIPSRLRYASSHWSFHLAETDEKWRERLKNDVQHIIKSPFVLYWMEILSFTGGVPRAIAGFRAVTRQIGLDDGIRRSMTEIRRFMMAFAVPIQDSAPHIYISALPFTPKESALHIEGLKMCPNTLTVTQGLEEFYPGLPMALRGHEAPVWGVAFSPDGSRIVSSSSDKTIRVWDADTGQPFGEPLRGHERSVDAVAFSRDGSRIVSGSYDTTIRQWETESRRPLGEPIRGHQYKVNAVAFSPDGLQIVSGSDDKMVRLWDADTGLPSRKPLQGHKSSVLSVAFSPDGSQIVSGSFDKTIRLWDVSSSQSLGEPLRGHESSVLVVAFSPDGSRIVSGSADNTIRIWDAQSCQLLGNPLYGHEGYVSAVSFSPDGSRIVSGSYDATLRLWDVDSGQPLGEPFRGHESAVWAVSFSPDGVRIASGANDKTIRLWDADSGEPLGEPHQGHREWVSDVKFSSDGSQILSHSDWEDIRLWDAYSGKPLEEQQGSEVESAIYAFDAQRSPDNLQIFYTPSDNTIRLWNEESGEPLGEPFQGHEGIVNSVSFSPDGSRIASGSNDCTIRLWDVKSGQPLGEPLRGHDDPVNSVSFSSDGSRVVSGSNDTTLRLWDVDSCQQVGHPLRGHEGSVLSVAFSPGGSRIVSGSKDKTIRVWDAEIGECGH
ncbi:hypothetical protein PIIN_04276 [Serendipita indica DSM 11827]|uniref:Nephrocystin 3-like N-terminal domain-containing protein n=1 Tax=Serendipita indica (strain DSM 11827) TaxID=1109443 RepID=G4TG91_SERID|nr:hypothetical protein PIIN_04276 [Serendipita indica DSM 11827]